MKLKSVIMIVVAAGAAFVASAGSESSPVRWYNGGVEAGWPNARSLRACSWAWDAEGADAEFDGGYVSFDANLDSPLSCVANREASLLNGAVEHVVTMIPSVELRSLEFPDPDAKIAFAVFAVSNSITDVVTSNYYGFAKDMTTNTWVQLSGAAYGGGEITVNIGMKYVASEGRAYANYTVTPAGGSPARLTYLGSEDVEIVIPDTKSRGVYLYGNGRVGSLSGSRHSKGSSVVPGMMFNR